MTTQLIDTVAYILTKNKKLLLVRSRGKKAFYMPGGKREKRETDYETLVRELNEELGIEIIKKSVVFFDEFKGQAYGESEGVIVTIRCYTGRHLGNPSPKGEIEELRFFSSEEYFSEFETAPAVLGIFKALKKAGRVE